MSHEVASMFSVGAMPWHGLGHVLDSAPSITDAIKLAGLDWRVGLRPMLSAHTDDGPLVVVPGQRAVWREDNGAILGTVGPDFEPLQNSEAFAFFEPLVAEGLLELETAGALRDGRRVWIMAKIPGDPAEIVKSDIVERYAMLSHGHDGSLALRLGFNPVRVVCANTLSLALSHGEGLFTLRHTSGLDASMSRARNVIAQQIRIFNESADAWRTLAARTCDAVAFDSYVLRVLAQPRGEGDDQLRDGDLGPTTGRRVLEQIRPFFEGGIGNDAEGVRGTWWAAYNAVTQWLTHARGASHGPESDRAARRFEALHLGVGRKLGLRALLFALDGAAQSSPSNITGAPAERTDAVDPAPFHSEPPGVA